MFTVYECTGWHFHCGGSEIGWWLSAGGQESGATLADHLFEYDEQKGNGDFWLSLKSLTADFK